MSICVDKVEWSISSLSCLLVSLLLLLPLSPDSGPAWAITLAWVTVFIQSVISLQIYSAPIYESFDTAFYGPGGNWALRNVLIRIAYRIPYVIFTCFVAALLPFFGDFIVLVGAMSVLPLNFVVTFILYAQVCTRRCNGGSNFLCFLIAEDGLEKLFIWQSRNRKNHHKLSLAERVRNVEEMLFVFDDAMWCGTPLEIYVACSRSSFLLFLGQSIGAGKQTSEFVVQILSLRHGRPFRCHHGRVLGCCAAIHYCGLHPL